MERVNHKIIGLFEQDDWIFVGATGSHHQFKHETKPGKVTVPRPKKDLPNGTVRLIMKQVGLIKPKE